MSRNISVYLDDLCFVLVKMVGKAFLSCITYLLPVSPCYYLF